MFTRKPTTRLHTVKQRYFALKAQGASLPSRTSKHARFGIIPSAMLSILVLLLIHGCSFQLRSANTHNALGEQTPRVIQVSESSLLQKHFVFARQLENTLYQLYAREAMADTNTNVYTLTINAISSTAYDAAMNYNRATTRQELAFDVTYQLLHKGEVVGARDVTIKRFLNLSPENPNSSTAERLLVRNEIYEEAARRMTQQINYLLSQYENLHSDSTTDE